MKTEYRIYEAIGEVRRKGATTYQGLKIDPHSMQDLRDCIDTTDGDVVDVFDDPEKGKKALKHYKARAYLQAGPVPFYKVADYCLARVDVELDEDGEIEDECMTGVIAYADWNTDLFADGAEM